MDYFPFVSGEILEDHTRGLNQERFSDMRAYLANKAYSNKKLLGSGLGNADGSSVTSSAFKAFNASHRHTAQNTEYASPQKSVASSQHSVSTNRLTRSVAPTVAAVKPLFDSVYLKPHENPRVI